MKQLWQTLEGWKRTIVNLLAFITVMVAQFSENGAVWLKPFIQNPQTLMKVMTVLTIVNIALGYKKFLPRSNVDSGSSTTGEKS